MYFQMLIDALTFYGMEHRVVKFRITESCCKLGLLEDKELRGTLTAHLPHWSPSVCILSKALSNRKCKKKHKNLLWHFSLLLMLIRNVQSGVSGKRLFLHGGISFRKFYYLKKNYSFTVVSFTLFHLQYYKLIYA